MTKRGCCRHRTLLTALALGFHACAGGAVPRATRTEPAARAPAPTIEQLKNMTYSGLGDPLGSVTLVNGRWAGDPPIAGAASRPIVELADSFRIVGDLDGDGADEAVVVLSYGAGGSATWSFLAVVARANGAPRNVATTALGDRVQIRSARIDGGRLLVSGVRAGANDAACCPGDLVEWQWTLGAGRLDALGATSTGRLALATLAGTVWVLRAWDIAEPARSEPVLTLAYDAGRFTGASGCNRYSAGVTAGDSPAAMAVGPIATTRMACPEPQSSVEARFLTQLGGARTFGFRFGRLAISCASSDGSRGTMLFEASTSKDGP